MFFLKQTYLLLKNYLTWKKLNKHNGTVLKYTGKDINKINVGKLTYGGIRAITYYDENEGLSIGNYCSLAGYTTFLLGGEHNYKFLSTFPFKNKLLQKHESFSKGPIIIDDDVWIGYNVTILSGTHIGQGAIIGAGTTVSGSVPPYAVYTNKGIVKYRFSEKIIKKLLKIDYKNLAFSIDKISKVYCEINEDNIDEIIKQVNK